MSELAAVCAAAAVAAVCAAALRRQVPELALVLAVCAGALILLRCAGALSALRELLDKLARAGGLSAQAVEPVLKTTGIAIVTRLSADLCRDAQEAGLASAVELAGTALALLTVLPLLTAVLELLGELL